MCWWSYGRGILEDLEDYRAGTVVTSVDYSKAFNRMSYQHCLAALARNGASTEVIRLVATFLTNRTMTVKIGGTMSSPLAVSGGCPQGSILGVFLFNATIDDLEAGCDDLGTSPASPVFSSLDGTPSDISEEEEASLTSVPSDEVSVTDEDGPITESFTETVGRVWMASSTPGRPGRRPPEIPASPILGLHGVSRRSKLRRKLKRRPIRLNYTEEMNVSLPPEPNHRTEAKWIQRLARLLRYVDDGFCLSKVNYENSVGFTVNEVKHRIKHAVQSQNVFRHIVKNAEEIGMKVNAAKTTLVCFSDSLSYKPDAYIEDSDGNVIRGAGKMKALGLRLSSSPNWNEHVAWIRKSWRSRLWILRNLKRSGFLADELVKVYKSMIRPIAEYACPVFHSGLTDAQDEELDRLQNQALMAIYGPRISARRMRDLSGLESLRARRITICDKFAGKCLANPRFQHWFPLKTTRSSMRTSKVTEKFKEEKARCDRLFNSPIFYFRRRLNGKPGKIYGKRNAMYRE